MRALHLLFCLLVLASTGANAAVTNAEAGRLGTALTPVGADRAGNKDGTIPSWTGGFTSSSPGYRVSAPRADPFGNEKPLFSITASNYRYYADRLPEGARTLFERYPEYRMNVYPTHRTAAMPASVYENIRRNATGAHAAAAGIEYGIDGAAGGVPFPIPKNGYEAVWNHLLAYWGPARELHLKTYVATADGAVGLTTSYNEVADFPFYYPGATPQSYGGYYFKTRHINDGPPAKVGQGYLNWQPVDTVRFPFAAWRLLPEEHRVRRSPSLSYDIPDPDASGFQNLDEYYVFFGGLDRYRFNIVGKKEMYVPYNNNRLYGLPVAKVMGPHCAEPDSLRYELHRIWVVDGVLAPGKHHVAPHRRLYLDEDTWFAVYSDSWDEDGKLWKFGQGTMYLMPDVPAVILGSQFVYDFDLGGYVYAFAFNDQTDPYKITAPHPASVFTPEALAAKSVR